jgi:hypothetical protein
MSSMKVQRLMTATEVKEECPHCGEQLYSGHPESLLNIKVTATLLSSPFTTIVFQYSQIDWASHDCEPNGILVSHYFPPNHSSPYGSAALVNYRSMKMERDRQTLNLDENG